MHADRQQRRTRTAVRGVTAALCAVLATLAGVALAGAISAERSADRLARSGDLVEAYLDLAQAVAIQDAAEEDAAEATRARSRMRFDAAGENITASLAVLARLGDRADRVLRARIARSERRYVSDIHRYFDALDADDAVRAETYETAADPSSQALQSLVSEGGPRQAGISLREIDDLRGSQERLLRFTLVSVLLGSLVVGALWLVLRSLRRRIDDATGAELERLEHEALTDSLTGIANHRAYEEDLVRALAAPGPQEAGLSLVLVDLDGLKAINDSRGHQAGDVAIRAVAERLSDTVGPGERVYRIGGDEFAALLPGASAWSAFDFSQRLHQAIGADDVAVAVSVGLAGATAESTRNGLIGQADIALREAKATGRGTVVFVPSMARPALPETVEDRRHRSTLAAALARAVDAKDSYTRSHSETVAELCALIATNLDLDDEHVGAIRLAGLVHDVGKIGVPDEILGKPAALDADEFAVIKTHSTLGHKILQGTDLSRESPWVLHHHERIDGGGYPGGLVGDEIPLESRIIHVADAFEAMTSDRPYRKGMPEERAIAELRRHAGSQFDPACVDALLAGLGPHPGSTVVTAQGVGALAPLRAAPDRQSAPR